MSQVHKEQLSAVDNALPNRSSLDVEIFGMEGVPEDIIQAHNQRVATQFQQAEAERQAVTGNPPPGTTATGGQPAKKPKLESVSDLKKRLAEHKAKMAEARAGGSSGEATPVGAGQTPTMGAYVSDLLSFESIRLRILMSYFFRTGRNVHCTAACDHSLSILVPSALRRRRRRFSLPAIPSTNGQSRVSDLLARWPGECAVCCSSHDLLPAAVPDWSSRPTAVRCHTSDIPDATVPFPNTHSSAARGRIPTPSCRIARCAWSPSASGRGGTAGQRLPNATDAHGPHGPSDDHHERRRQGSRSGGGKHRVLRLRGRFDLRGGEAGRSGDGDGDTTDDDHDDHDWRQIGRGRGPKAQEGQVQGAIGVFG